MRRIVLITAAMLFGFSIVGISILRENAPFVYSSEEEIQVNDSEASEAAGKEAVQDVKVLTTGEQDYPLPYPGMLPDHPMYFLKMVRDRLQLWITRDSLGRPKLLLHYADKRIAAALVLVEKGKLGLAVSTATKAEKYLEQVFSQVKRLDTGKSEVRDLYMRLSEASDKHSKVLAGIRSRVTNESGEVLDDYVSRNQKMQSEVEEIIGKGGSEGGMQLDEERENLEEEMNSGQKPEDEED